MSVSSMEQVGHETLQGDGLGHPTGIVRGVG